MFMNGMVRNEREVVIDAKSKANVTICANEGGVLKN